MTRDDFYELKELIQAGAASGSIREGLADTMLRRLFEIRCEDCALEEAAIVAADRDCFPGCPAGDQPGRGLACTCGGRELRQRLSRALELKKRGAPHAKS